MTPVTTAKEIDDLASIGDMMRESAARTRNKTPVESLKNALERANMYVDVLDGLVATLRPRAKSDAVTIGEGTPRESVVWTTETHDQGLIGPDPDGKLSEHPWVKLHQAWTAEQAKLSKMAMDHGLEERQTRVKEAEMGLMGEAMMGILSDLGVDLNAPEVKEIIHARLAPLDDPIDIRPGLTATVTGS